MQYKSYVWPHNPRTYTIQYVRKVAWRTTLCLGDRESFV